ncbi:MAG: hypothetical protein HY666_04125 [Chloroflexi bacterium]|nr:hypothetical protein [Chloroflexota bacterium]
MGLDIGIITIQYLERPTGHAYEFAKEMAWGPNVYYYMQGVGNNWCAFTQRQVLQMLEDFTQEKGLDSPAKTEILEWIRSLPWDGWQDDFALGAGQEDEDRDLFLDYDDNLDGGLIELHFNW